MPGFKAATTLLPELQFMVDQANSNKETWKTKVDEYQELMDKQNNEYFSTQRAKDLNDIIQQTWPSPKNKEQ